MILGCPQMRYIAATNEIPFERLKKEGLSSLSREYIIDGKKVIYLQTNCSVSLRFPC